MSRRITCIQCPMGCVMNVGFAENGEVRIGLTYMTGTLVKMGKGITAALLGGDPLGWAPYFLLWLGLVVGAGLGATAYLHVGAGALWLAAGAMILITLAAARLRFHVMPAPDVAAD